MKKQLIILLLVVAGLPVMAQRRGKTKAPVQQSHAENLHKKTYRQALQYGDATTAINSLYYIIVGEGDSAYKDSLAMLYFNIGMYAQCERVCNELDTNSEPVMQMLAYSQKALGITLPALESFQALAAKTQNKLHAYELANLQLLVERYVEFDNTITQAKDWQNGKEGKVFIQTTAQKGQQVPVGAALLHLSAIKEANKKNYAQSAKIYEEALALFPEFELAKANMETIKKLKIEKRSSP